MDIKEIIKNADAEKINITIPVSDLLKLYEEIAQEKISVAQEKKDHISVIEFQKRTGVSRVTCWRWEKAGILNKIKIGGKVYYSTKEVDNLLKSRDLK